MWQSSHLQHIPWDVRSDSTTRWTTWRTDTARHSHSHPEYHGQTTADRGLSWSLCSPSVFCRCWLGGRKGIRPVEHWVVGAGVVICLERGADLHMAQLMPLPLTVSGPLNGCVCCSTYGWHLHHHTSSRQQHRACQWNFLKSVNTNIYRFEKIHCYNFNAATLQSSVAPYFRCDAVANNQIKKGLLLSVRVKFFFSKNGWIFGKVSSKNVIVTCTSLAWPMHC